MIENNSIFVIFNLTNETSFLTINATPNATPISSTDEIYPIRDSLRIVIPITILYSLIFISGMLGNIITCIVIARNRAMHTATNYYLFSLAISDLLLLISGLPIEMYEVWFRYPFPFGEAVCILRGFAAETSANATVFTITAFTAERYIAICHPFLSHTMSKLSRAIKFILGIWLLAMGLAIPQILDLGLTKPFDTCGMKQNARKHVFTFSSVLCFALPMTVITVLYILIGLQLRRSKIVGRATAANGNSIRLKTTTKYRVPSQRNILLTLDRSGKANSLLTPVPSPNVMEAVYNETKQEVSQKISNPIYDEGRKNYSQKGCMGTRHVVNMLVAVVVAFFLCWAPHHAQRLFAMHAEEKYSEIYDVLTNISGVLYYISTCINPFLYNIMSHKFREAFKDTCARYIYRRGRGTFKQGTLSRNISQRSNSQSIHTCSSICSGQLMQNTGNRILDQDLSLIKCSKRPLTVKFRRAPLAARLQQQNFATQGGDLYDCNDYRISVCTAARDTTNNQFVIDVYNKSPIYHSYNETSNAIRLSKYRSGCNSDLGNYCEKSKGLNERLIPDTEFVNKCRSYGTCTMEPTSNEFSRENGIAEVSDNDPQKIDFSLTDGEETSAMRTRSRTLGYDGPERNHYITSPYQSPELTITSRRLEENIQNMLKELVLYDNSDTSTLKSKRKNSKNKTMLKSKSTSHIATSTAIDLNGIGKIS